MKRRELLILLLPCLALAGLAGLLRVREQAAPVVTPVQAAPAGPFRLVMKATEKIPLQPDDVAGGIDTRVRVLLGHTGTAPPGWGTDAFGEFTSDTRLLVHRNGKWVRLMDAVQKEFKGHGIPMDIRSYNREQDAYEFVCNLRLRDVPAAVGELVLQSDWYYRPGSNMYTFVVSPASFLSHPDSEHTGSRLVVRRVGETITLPRLSRDPQIEVRREVVRPLTAKEKVGYAGNDTKVEIHAFYNGPLKDTNQRPVHNAGRYYLQDATGKEHIYNIICTSDKVPPESKRINIIVYYFNLKQTKLRGKVTFHAQLQHDDLWPLPVAVTVRH